MTGILVVEHDAELRGAMAEALREAGFDVRMAADGQGALARLSAGPRPALILLDLNLMDPGMNGWELRAALLRDPDLAPIPVAVLFDAGSEDEMAEHLAAAAALRRPFRADQLVGMVQACIGPPCGPADSA